MGVVLLIVQASILAPLIWKAWRDRDGSGVALSGESMWAVAGIGWIGYGIGVESTTLIISGTLAAAGSGVTWALLSGSKPSREKVQAAVIAVALSVIFVGSWTVAGVVGLSAALAVFGVVQFGPQAFETARCAIARVPTPGVSIAASSMRSSYTAGWAFYAFAGSPVDWPLATWGAAGCVVFAAQALTAVFGSRKEPVRQAELDGTEGT